MILAPGLGVALAAMLVAVIATTNISVAQSRSGGATSSPATACRPPFPAWAQTRSYYLRISNATHAGSQAHRDSFSIPTGVADSAAYFVSNDSLLCARAALAHARKAGEDTLNPASVYLLRFGATRYMTSSDTYFGNHYMIFVFDANFSHLNSIGQ